MSKIKLLSIAVIGLLLVNLGILAFLFLRKPVPPPGGPEGRREMPRDVIIRRLHLDKEQVARYEELIRDHQRSIRELDGQIRDSKNHLYETLKGTGPADKDSFILRIGFLQTRIESVHYNHFLDIKSLLHPDQLKDYEQLTGELSKFFAPHPKPDGPPGE